MKRFWMLLFVLTACLPYAGGLAPSPQFPIRGTAFITSYFDWETSPWFRISDSYTGPWRLLITDGNRACLVDAPVWTLARIGELHACESGWRNPRL